MHIRVWPIAFAFAFAGTFPIAPAHAAESVVSIDDGYKKLDAFLQGLTALEAEFRQTLRDSQGRVVETSTGTLAIRRPNRFRWDYREPHSQVIVADGERLWLYDTDLQQVTVRRLDQTLAGTPAMLLSGQADLRTGFEVERVESKDGLTWVALTPKRSDTDFRRVRLGLRGDALAYMELEDKLGQTTLLEFSHFVRNPKVDAARFVFTPPPGADVIGDGGSSGGAP
jgi:outer membrane lipoprotein carrier protein